jgi:hypothetical protein
VAREPAQRGSPAEASNGLLWPAGFVAHGGAVIDTLGDKRVYKPEMKPGSRRNQLEKSHVSKGF